MGAAVQLGVAELFEGATASVTFDVSALEMQQFAELSGDFNPLHTDDAFARGKGYAGRVVYGALLLAKVSQLIGMRLPGRDAVWASISFDFRKPLYVGETAQIDGTVLELHPTTRMLRLGLVLWARGTQLAKGKAEVIVGA